MLITIKMKRDFIYKLKLLSFTIHKKIFTMSEYDVHDISLKNV